ncbi:MAG: universal stress protein [Anaerolineae bacterium]|nr:universal stress protein [Anaerolineae bacterium]
MSDESRSGPAGKPNNHDTPHRKPFDEHEIAHALEAEAWYRGQASRLSHRWEERLDQFNLPCPICNGALVFQGARRSPIFEFSEGEPGIVTPLKLLALTFTCSRCGYTADFDAELFNPSRLAELQGAAPEQVAALSVAEYRVLVSLAGDERNETMIRLASTLAGERKGEVVALHVSRGKAHDEGLLWKLQNYRPDIGDPAVVRLLSQESEDVGEAIVRAARRQRAQFILIGWRGWSRSEQAIMGTVLDTVLNEAVSDVGLVHDRGLRDVRRILLPTAGGPNTPPTLHIGLDLARAYEAELHLLVVVQTPEEERGGYAVLDNLLREARLDRHHADHHADVNIEQRVIVAKDFVQTVVAESSFYDLLLIGAPHRTWRGTLRLNNKIGRIVRNAAPTAVVVSARQSPFGLWFNRIFG